MKALKIVLAIVGIFGVLYGIAYVRHYQVTLPIHGVVVDATTGKPLEKVLVRSLWHTSRPAIVDTTSSLSGYDTVTDREGRFTIPKRNVTRVLGRFNLQTLTLDHPLYEYGIANVFVEGKGYQYGVVEGPIFIVTLKISTLEEKYTAPEDLRELITAIDSIHPEHFTFMKRKFSVDYDMKELLSVWERVLLRHEYLDDANKRDARDRCLVRLKFRLKDLIKA